MRNYHRLTREERYQIEVLYKSKHSIREIGRLLKRAPSTISRELKNNRIYSNYVAVLADLLASRSRRRNRNNQVVIQGDLEADTCAKLALDWSPEQINRRLKKEGKPTASVSTIYRYIYVKARDGINLWHHLRRRRREPVPHGTGKHPNLGGLRIANRKNIKERPAMVQDRTRLGDYERDLVRGKFIEPVILTIVDRKSRLIKLAWLPKKSSELVHKATVKLLKKDHVFTITNDNGTEFTQHERTAKKLHADIYFADPQASWQRGSNENANGLLRQYFSKTSDFSKITPEILQHVEKLMNNRPRKCLGYQTPNEVHHTP